MIPTGLASQPLLPSFPGIDAFSKPIIHFVRLEEKAKSLISNASIVYHAVVGGSKPAHDAVYIFPTAGESVTWLTRRNGCAAMPIANPYTQMGSGLKVTDEVYIIMVWYLPMSDRMDLDEFVLG